MKFEKPNFTQFVSFPQGENLLKHIFWQKWWILNALQLQKLENVNFTHFSRALLVKTIQIHILTKVRAWTIRKLRKWSQFVPITFLNQHCPTIFFKLMSTLLKNSFHALYWAAPSGARLARPCFSYFHFWKIRYTFEKTLKICNDQILEVKYVEIKM